MTGILLIPQGNLLKLETNVHLQVWTTDTVQLTLLSSSCPHISPHPEKNGPIYWLSGPPGSGKSTTCQMMAKERGYVYYEADCIANLINPFTDINAENPSIAGFKSQPLKVSTRSNSL